MRRRRTPGRGRGKGVRLLGILAVLVAVAVFLGLRLRPMVERMAAYQVRVFAAKTVNDAVLNEMERYAPDYTDMVQLGTNQSGDITSIQTNMMEVNRLKSNITRAVIADLESLGTSSIYVPLGTLLGNEFFSGRGPGVEIKITPSGYVQTEIYSQFTSAGINQTLHQIMLKTTVQMTAIIPGYTIVTQTDTSICIAQTVIVGSIPESFTQINGDEAPLISKINDYATG